MIVCRAPDGQIASFAHSTAARARTISAAVGFLANTYLRSIQVARNSQIQAAAEAWLLDFLRHLWRTQRSAFTSELESKLRTKTLPEKRVPVLEIGSAPKSGTYIFSKNALIRFDLSDSRLYWVGPNGGRFPYTIDELERDLNYHSQALAQLDGVLDSIDPSQAVETASAELIEEITSFAHREIEKRFHLRREALGLERANLLQSTRRQHRVTHCYACMERLESGFFLECGSCGWLVCTCGACGCGYAAGEG